MLDALLYVSVTGLSMALGFTVGWLGGRGRAQPSPADVTPEVERTIQEAATRWAGARGRPWAAPLIADKLRLAYRLREQTARRDQP
jgi:hypothetical protein